MVVLCICKQTKRKALDPFFYYLFIIFLHKTSMKKSLKKNHVYIKYCTFYHHLTF